MPEPLYNLDHDSLFSAIERAVAGVGNGNRISDVLITTVNPTLIKFSRPRDYTLPRAVAQNLRRTLVMPVVDRFSLIEVKRRYVALRINRAEPSSWFLWDAENDELIDNNTMLKAWGGTLPSAPDGVCHALLHHVRTVYPAAAEPAGPPAEKKFRRVTRFLKSLLFNL